MPSSSLSLKLNSICLIILRREPKTLQVWSLSVAGGRWWSTSVSPLTPPAFFPAKLFPQSSFLLQKDNKADHCLKTRLELNQIRQGHSVWIVFSKMKQFYYCFRVHNPPLLLLPPLHL
ncbi:hypothetical protein Pfo_025561 [Paulownia fortunei]|nr:hypothetical protein Pfo_025561 [Paulownia fortunei]